MRRGGRRWRVEDLGALSINSLRDASGCVIGPDALAMQATVGAHGEVRGTPRQAGDSGLQERLFALFAAAFPEEEVVAEYTVLTRSPGDGKCHRRRVDVAFPAYSLAIEADGWRFHARFPSAFAIHTRRQNELIIANWRLLRYTAAMVNAPECVVADVTAAIRRGASVQKPERGAIATDA